MCLDLSVNANYLNYSIIVIHYVYEVTYLCITYIKETFSVALTTSIAQSSKMPVLIELIIRSSLDHCRLCNTCAMLGDENADSA